MFDLDIVYINPENKSLKFTKHLVLFAKIRANQ